MLRYAMRRKAEPATVIHRITVVITPLALCGELPTSAAEELLQESAIN